MARHPVTSGGLMPRSTLAARLAEAKQVGATLGKATDELNDSFEKFETALIDLNLGITCGAQLPADEGEEAASLLFMKHGTIGEWSLLIRTNRQVLPIKSASRENRIKAAGALTQLLDVMLATVESQITDVHEAKHKVDSVLGEFPVKSGPTGAAGPTGSQGPAGLPLGARAR